jgi:hypothetical protein
MQLEIRFLYWKMYISCVLRLNAQIAYLKFVLEELVIVDLILKSLYIHTESKS